MQILEKASGGPLTFARLIHSVRVTDEFTQVELASVLGISKSHLCDLEKGRRKISAERAAKFAEILGYSPEVWVSIALQDSLEPIKYLGLQVSVARTGNQKYAASSK